MPDSVLVQTASGVLAALEAAAAGTFTLPFTAERSYADWQMPMKDFDQLRVDVVPVGPLDTELESRGQIRYSPAVDLVVRYRFGESEQKDSDGRIKVAEIDNLVLLVEQLAEFFTADRLAADTDIVWEDTKILAAYKPSHLREHRQFTGLIRITFSTDTQLA